MLEPALRTGGFKREHGRHSVWRMRRAAVLVVPVVVFLGGCHGVGTDRKPMQRAFRPELNPDALSDVAFLHYLATVPVATVDEGMRAVLILVDDRSGARTFEKRTQVLHEQGVVRQSWNLTCGQILDKGTLAYMLRRVCGVSPSVGEVLASCTGLGDRRAALKTCVDAGLLPYGVSTEPVKGGELLSAIAEAERILVARGR